MPQQPQPHVDFENTTCVFVHPTMQGVYFCNDSPVGYCQDLHSATKFMGSASRVRGMLILLDRFPKISHGDLMFFYLAN